MIYESTFSLCLMNTHSKNIIVPKKIHEIKQIAIQPVIISNLTLLFNRRLMCSIEWKLGHQKTSLWWVEVYWIAWLYLFCLTAPHAKNESLSCCLTYIIWDITWHSRCISMNWHWRVVPMFAKKNLVIWIGQLDDFIVEFPQVSC